MSWIDNALSLLEQSWLGTTVTIVSFALAILVYLWTRRRTRMAFVYLGEHLLGSASDALPPSIVVQYDGMSIPRLTKTTLIIWNSGETTVSGTDIVAKDPLRLRVGNDGVILSTSILKISREVNDFKVVSPSKDAMNEAHFTFDFLDQKDGVVVEILHTSTNRKPFIKGTLKGLPEGFLDFGLFTKPRKKSKPLIVVTDWVFSPAVFACAGMLFALYSNHSSSSPDQASINSFLPGAIGGFLLMWAINSFTSRRRYPKSLYLETLE